MKDKFGNVLSFDKFVSINDDRYVGPIVGFKSYMTMEGDYKERVCVRVVTDSMKVFDKWVKCENVELMEGRR